MPPFRMYFFFLYLFCLTLSLATRSLAFSAVRRVARCIANSNHFISCFTALTVGVGELFILYRIKP
ncbi:hypothetical protein GcM1_c14151o44 [Golovinomyces cichoracearum]|uniref:Secreted protein n=1 Tax=Golovinomyces cichoracearum TaxID=62708 RepID=A0A420IJM2_9PEZI|nr:hypothetical protein GcM1_c14151o44 [Golovinomyces cichoracearum]